MKDPTLVAGFIHLWTLWNLCTPRITLFFLEIPLLGGLVSLFPKKIKKSKFNDHTVIRSVKKTAVKRPWRANRCINILLIACMVAGREGEMHLTNSPEDHLRPTASDR
jgi:hypothetical protein